MPFHSPTISTLAYLLPLSLDHLPQQKTPSKLVILYNKSIADAHPSFLLEEAILLKTALKGKGNIGFIGGMIESRKLNNRIAAWH